VNAPVIHFYPGLSQPPSPAPRPCLRFSWALVNGPPTFNAATRGLALTPVEGVHLAVSPDAQAWQQLPDGHWLGVATPPEYDPLVFLRDNPCPGIRVILGDRQVWTLPRVNPMLLSCLDLPTQDRLIPAPPAAGPGALRPRLQFETLPLPRYLPLAERARALVDHCWQGVVNGDQRLVLDDADLREFLAAVVAVNYDLTLEEMAALGLFAAATDGSAVLAVICWAEALAALTAGLPQFAAAAAATIPPASPAPGSSAASASVAQPAATVPDPGVTAASEVPSHG
jgi:hypothetical protein